MITYENVQSMKQSVALITGANTGIGRVTALTLARRGYQLILAGRSEQRTQAVIDEILHLGVVNRPHYVPLALDDLDSVRACVKRVIALDLPIRLLINNAGVAGLKGQTKQSYEMAFGVNTRVATKIGRFRKSAQKSIEAIKLVVLSRPNLSLLCLSQPKKHQSLKNQQYKS